MSEMTLQLPLLVAANIEQFTGRTWVLPQMLDWYRQSNERILLLTGGPGSGKSVVMAWLAGYGPDPDEPEARVQLSLVREQVKALHFCQAASQNITPQAFAESMANQLTRNVKGFGDALAATLVERVQVFGTARACRAEAGASLTGVHIGRIDLGALGDELSFDRALTQPLKKLYANGREQPMLLLVDALDEAETYTGVKLPQLLAKLRDLPSPVRILATCRPDPRVPKYYRGAPSIDLIRDAPAGVDDVGAYAAARLARHGTGLTGAHQAHLAARISGAAKGIFLYTAMVLDDLLSRLPEVPDVENLPLPNGLCGLYHDFLNRELGSDEDRWYEHFRPVLGLIAVGQGEGLTRAQLGPAGTDGDGARIGSANICAGHHC